MPVDEKMVARVRELLPKVKKLEEKKMFSGMCFMVNEKMCVCVEENSIMCRVGPDAYEKALEKNGCRPMVNGGKVMKGFVFVDIDVLRSKKELGYWVDLCMAFNKEAKSSKKKK